MFLGGVGIELVARSNHLTEIIAIQHERFLLKAKLIFYKAPTYSALLPFRL